MWGDLAALLGLGRRLRHQKIRFTSARTRCLINFFSDPRSTTSASLPGAFGDQVSDSHQVDQIEFAGRFDIYQDVDITSGAGITAGDRAEESTPRASSAGCSLLSIGLPLSPNQRRYYPIATRGAGHNHSVPASRKHYRE